ncbi:MAG: ABC transporter permease, partial [Acidobacteriaceae bacterium]|nr:ABC transporter permease [Acidobacteriaceae bacterium]
MQSLGDTFGQVFRAIWANKLRSFLTMFGIAWGVGSMLLLISVGEGFRSGNRRQLATFGNDLIMMWGGTIPAVPNQHTGMRPYNLTLSDADAIRTQAPDVRAAVALLNRDDIKQQSQFQTAGGDVVGTEPNYDEVRFLPIAEGRFLNDDDMRNRNHV